MLESNYALEAKTVGALFSLPGVDQGVRIRVAYPDSTVVVLFKGELFVF